MRAILRVGIITGVCAIIALSALQQAATLAAVLGIVVTGAVAGTGAAKWLEWAWYGRQFEAGWRTGAVACGVAGLGTFVSLLIAGPHDSVALAAHSQLLGVDLGPLARGLAGLGWLGTDFLLVLASTALGIGLSAVTALVFALGKSARAVSVITEARQAAQANNRTEPLSTPLPLPGYPSLASPASGATWHTSPQTGVLPAPGAYPASLTGASPSGAPQFGQAAPDSGRGPSTARPVERELDDDEREALARWAEEHAGDASGPRTPAPSTYLNSPSPAPKRNRKKQQTRDWLC